MKPKHNIDDAFFFKIFAIKYVEMVGGRIFKIDASDKNKGYVYSINIIQTSFVENKLSKLIRTSGTIKKLDFTEKILEEKILEGKLIPAKQAKDIVVEKIMKRILKLQSELCEVGHLATAKINVAKKTGNINITEIKEGKFAEHKYPALSQKANILRIRIWNLINKLKEVANM